MKMKVLPILPALLALAGCQSGAKQSAPIPTGFGSAITMVSGEKQITGVGQVLEDPVVLQVNDEKGAPVPGALVEFESPDGIRFTPAQGLTGIDGQFTVSAALGGTSGHSLIRAFTRDKSGKTAEVKITEIALGYQQTLGREVSEKYCARCHDPESSPARVSNHDNLSKPPHAFSDGAAYNAWKDANLLAIVAHGGQALGKSPEMPPYGDTLSKSEMSALIGYIRAVSDPPYRAMEVVYADK